MSSNQCMTLITRAHSFPQNFEPSCGNWVFTAEFCRGIRLLTAEIDVFHSFNRKMTSK